MKSAEQFASMFTHRLTSAILLIVSQLLKSVRTLSLFNALRKTELLSHSSNSFVTILRDYAGWSLTGNRNQNGISSGLKSDRGSLRNLSSGRLRESF